LKRFTVQDLAKALQGKEYFTVEELAEELSISQGEVHRALLKLRVQPGWSIIASNQVAYGRHLVGPHRWPDAPPKASHRWRKKPKTAADYDPNEPEWTPTVFCIKKRGDG